MSTAPLVCRPLANWRPKGHQAAICFSVDDVHPATSRDPYEAGGDLGAGALGHLEWLLERHPQLRVTLFVTPDWRMIRGRVERSWRARLPWLGRWLHLARRHPRGAMRLDRHPTFCRYLEGLPRTELALHGLHHDRRGDPVHVEFLGRGRRACRRTLARSRELFRRAGLAHVPGFAPPGWHLSPPLAAAAAELGLRFVASARDLGTPVRPGAATAESGLVGAPLCEPGRLNHGGLLHFTTNFQATSPLARAWAIVDQGGLLSIKAHVAKRVMDHVMADGLDLEYREMLHRLFSELEVRYGDRLAWTTFGALARSLTAEMPA